jgi:hypothetical protein
MMVRIGVLLIVLSAVCWVLIPFVPAFGLRGMAAAGVAGGLVVGAEVVFWLGLVLAGRDTWRLAKEHGWRGTPKALWRLLRHGKAPAGMSDAGTGPS